MSESKLQLVTPIEVDKFASSQVGKLEELLSTQEILTFQKLKSEKRKRDWLAGRLAAKELLCAHLGQALGYLLPWEKIEIYNGTAGEPCFRLLGDRLPININISIAHSHGYGLCGLANTKEEGYIGVDIERIRPLRSDVQRRFLAQTEIEQIKQSFAGRESEGATLFWALKEAAFKALYYSLQVNKLASLKVMKNTEISLTEGRKAVIIYAPLGMVLSAAYKRHANFFLAQSLLAPTKVAVGGRFG